MSHIDIPEEDKVDRVGLLELMNHPDKRWALFVRGSSANSAKFKFVFETKEEAIEKAKEYSSQRVANGSFDFTFYIVEIKHMIGIQDGKMIDHS